LGLKTIHHRVTYPIIPRGASYPKIPGSESMGRLHITTSERGARAELLWKLLSGNVDRRGIRVITNTPARKLITNQKGEVVGVLAERDGEQISIMAKRGLILTCGGFEYDEAMKRDFLPCPFFALGIRGTLAMVLEWHKRSGLRYGICPPCQLLLVSRFPSMKLRSPLDSIAADLFTWTWMVGGFANENRTGVSRNVAGGVPL